MTQERISVILADDQTITRSGLKALFEKDERIFITGEASTGREALKAAQDLRPRIVIMEVNLPELNGVDAARQIVALNLGIDVIALTMSTHRQFVAGMLKSGAKGYLLKSCSVDELRHAIVTVAEDKTYLSPLIAHTVVQDYLHASASRSAVTATPELTGREREVLQLIAEGVSSRDIGQRLFVSESTVNTHRRQIMEKLNIHSIAKLTKFAVQEGLTTLDR